MQKVLPDSINKNKAVSDVVLSVENIPLLRMDDPEFPDELVKTFRNIGFVMVANHGIPSELIDEAFRNGRRIFDLPLQDKKLQDFDFEKNRGYSSLGEEVLEENHTNDEKKQTLDLGDPDDPYQLKFYPKDDQFIRCSRSIYDQMFGAYFKVMNALEKGLKLKQGTITQKCCKQKSNQSLRYLFYPQMSYETLKKQGKIRCGAHSDYGSVTLLFQKPGFGQSGLRALNAENKWVKVNPPDYAMVINLGDILQHWTNDKLISTIHRVEVDDEVWEKLESGQLEKAPERQSMVMFCDPDCGQILECLPGFGQPKYEPINGKEYVMGRIMKTYGKDK